MATAADKLAARYDRIAGQLEELLDQGPKQTEDPIARMATACALLSAKMPHFFWTGFYLLKEGKLVVGPYQGPLACAVLPGPEGVCWAAVQQKATVLVPDVHAFPGHVACDSRSQSEIVVPLREPAGNVIGVLDVDSDQPDAFGPVDQAGLEKITAWIMGH
jgi:GAF domain-containing protein|nr:GAF domain-containing protein [Candidatus Krumholzibacteria bacterium]